MKYIIIFINALIIAICHFLFGDPVTATAKVPEGITPGSNFVMEVTISKPSVTGFAKLQIEIPPAFVATEGDNKGGSFSASGTVVKIIWTSVPSDAELTVKINVTVPASASGEIQVKGKFSYITDNVKQEAPFDPITINLGGSNNAVATTNTNVLNEPAKESETTTQTNQSTTNTDTASQAFSKSNEPDASVSVNRKITSLEGADNFQVDLTIKKGNIKGFAKLSEKIPAGYKADGINVSGASFAFDAGEAKFIWTSIPTAEEINVSYKLFSDVGATIQKPAYIEGSKFSYIESDQTKKIVLDKQEIIAGEAGSVVATTTEPNNTTTSDNKATTNTPTDNNATTTTKSDNVKTPDNNTTDNTTATTAAKTPQSGNVHYSVQIGAFQKGVHVGSLKRKFGIQEAVKTEMQDGFTKCIYGKYGEYKIARDNRETAKGKGVTDAFVTAYNSGKRITVQEALMVSNQKWYR